MLIKIKQKLKLKQLNIIVASLPKMLLNFMNK